MLFGAAGSGRHLCGDGRCYAVRVQGLPMLLLVLAAIGCYAMSLGPVTWVVISEIFPNRIRGAAMAVAVTALWLACFILTFTFPLLNKWLGSAGTFWLYAADLRGRICLRLLAAARDERQDIGRDRARLFDAVGRAIEQRRQMTLPRRRRCIVYACRSQPEIRNLMAVKNGDCPHFCGRTPQ